jgi:hypothetical protein
MHLVGYLYEDYHDARSLEHKIGQNYVSLFFSLPNFGSKMAVRRLWTER